MGFGVRWRRWINLCISTALISVNVNGNQSKLFSMKRGLRQGCPLSPLLFNIVSEALSSLIHKAVKLEIIEGVHVGSAGFKISHIQFADDLIIFSKGNRENVINIKRILRIFELASGLSLNSKKTSVSRISVEQGCSIAERICLVRSVLSNLPIYFLSYFQMSISVADKLNKLSAQFIWGPNSSKPIRWVKWDNMTKPSEVGGLGIVDAKLKNRAMLNKWVWRFSQEPYYLWRKVINSKYEYPENMLLPENGVERKHSWVWRNIMRSLHNQEDAFTKNIAYNLGDGRSVNF
ncbi:hypothetical protein HRI_004151500 [Hibiscus trionum]|uniref:Reverse transcriptase domain-containing protein n=1 Tax=Hibiscus trionum TaxID=183268 RepID=A0A9W7MHS1_HIBTR|nr:hypothetical protein HRI_004151500 [Hibiscus trionum]